jgi:hypothetical protein
MIRLSLRPRIGKRHAFGPRTLSLDGCHGPKDFPSLGLLLQRKLYSSEHSLQGAGHAVVMTLYSRAHRIGLNGISCLLRGLRNGLSLDLFLILAVGVLA